MAVVLGENEPPTPHPPHETVHVTTTAVAPRSRNDNSQDPTHDVIHTSVTGGKFNGPLHGTVWLNYDGGGTNGQGQSKHIGHKSHPKNFTITRTGNLNTPSFTPGDLGLPSWQTGRYWYDILINKQKDMTGAINTPNRQASESFTIGEQKFGLDVSTTASPPDPLDDSSSAPTHDVFHVSANATTHGAKLTGTISLHYDGGGKDANGKDMNLAGATAKQTIILDKQGDIDGPTYTPSDINKSWKTWQTGHYWYDVTIPKQGRLSHAVQTSSSDPSESFDIGMKTVSIGVTTNASAPANLTDESTEPTHDTFNVSGDMGSASLNGTISLHYDGGGTDDNGNSKNIASSTKDQPITISSTGESDGPTYTPSDLGMSTWQTGHYWYDVHIPAQGRLMQDVQTDSSDPAESFDIRMATFTPHVTTSRQSPTGLKTGDETPVTDSITMSGGKMDQTFNGTVTLHFADNPYVPPATVSKQFTISGAGTVTSPTFTPADFGWSATGSPKRYGWQAGTYWFTVHMDRQGRMDSPVNTADRDNSEMFTLKEVVPPTPGKKIENGHAASSMPDRTVINSQTGRGGYKMVFVDTFTNPDKLNYTVGNMKVTDTTDKSDWTNRFTFSDGKNSPSQVTATYNGKDELPLGHSFEFTLTVTLSKPGEEQKLIDKASVIWNDVTGTTDSHHFYTHKPNPDKVWVLDRKGALQAEDPKWTNSVDYTKSPGAADNETFLPGDPVAAVVNGRVPYDLIHNLNEYKIVDDWSDAAKYVDFSDVSKAAVFYGGTDVTSQFTITNNGTTTVAVAKPGFLSRTVKLAKDTTVKLVISGTFCTNYRTNGKMVRLTNAGSEQWNDQEEKTNIPAVFTWTPSPDKAWIRNEKTDGSGKWLAVIDPTKSNRMGGDRKTYREGDPVGFVVNGTIPTGLALKPVINFTDDYGMADYVWDPADLSQWKVYDADASDVSQSSISGIVAKGRDVTKQFVLSQKGTLITAQASDTYETSLMHLKTGRQIVLLVPGRIDLANGRGNQQVYADTGFKGNTSWIVTKEKTHDKDSHGYRLCIVPKGNSEKTTHQYDGRQFLNTANESAGKVTVPTNQPPICVWVPNVVKSVIASQDQGGDNHNGEAQLVRPNQQVRYNLHLFDTVQTTDQAGYPVVKAGVTDIYDPMETLDYNEIHVINNQASGKQLTIGRDYTVNIDRKNHTFHIEFTQSYIQSHWAPGDTIDINVSFLARVSSKIPARYIARNRYQYEVNNGISVSNEVHNQYIPPKPRKADTQKNAAIDINGKRLLLGDTAYYRLTLDATSLTYNLGDEDDPQASQGKQLYKVQRLGMVDNYDEQYLKVLQKNIKVLDPDGKDVTSRFNVQAVKGKGVYVFAKTVDTTIPVSGTAIKGDPQPAGQFLPKFEKDLLAENIHQPKDLDAYWHMKLDKLRMAYIDQKLLGRNYQIVIPAKVIKVTNGYNVKNVAIENVDDQNYLTNQVHNPLVKINPRKDVVVNVGDKSVNGKDIYLHHYFLYRLDSSKRPTDLAYPVVTDWKITDKLEPAYDRYTGAWAVYANADLYSNDYQLLARKGEKIAGTGFDTSKLKAAGVFQKGDTSLFVARQTTDGTVTVAATASYRLLASSAKHPMAWSAYLQVQRMKPTTRHNNQFTEVLNGQPRPSNIVWTRTPDLTPSMRVEKYDLKSGLKLGDRNHPSEALNPAVDGTRIGLLIVNTGHSDLHKFGMADQTIAGNGTVSWDQADLQHLVHTTLKPGQSITIKGTLHGVTQIHTDRANVVSSPILPCPTPMDGVDKTPSIDQPQNGTSVKYCDSTPIKAHDDWNGKNVPAPLANTGVRIATILLAAVLLALIGLLIWMGVRHHAGKPSHAK